MSPVRFIRISWSTGRRRRKVSIMNKQNWLSLALQLMQLVIQALLKGPVKVLGCLFIRR